jgi:hypothetical protein
MQKVLGKHSGRYLGWRARACLALTALALSMGASAAPPDAGVALTQFYAYEEGGSKAAIGVIENNSDSTVHLIRVEMTFTDGKETVIGNESMYASLQQLKPGERTSFYAPLPDYLSTLEHSEAVLSWDVSDEEPIRDVAVSDIELGEEGDNPTIGGTLRNTGSETLELIGVAYTCYDAADEIAAAYLDRSDADLLAPGETTTFSNTIYSARAEIARCEALTQATVVE